MEDLQRSICIFHLKSSYCKLSNLFILSSDQSSLNILLFAAKSVLFLQGFDKWKVCLCFNRGQKMTLCCKDRGNTNIKKSLTTLGQYSTPALLFLLGDRNQSSTLVQSSLFTKNTSTILIPLALWKQIQITFHKFERSYLTSSQGPTKDCLSHCLLVFADR